MQFQQNDQKGIEIQNQNKILINKTKIYLNNDMNINRQK